MVEVVVVGDANPDLVLHGDVVPRFGQAEQLLDGADLLLGGSGAIVAHGLATLGRAVRLVAAIGTDPLGELVRGQLARGGVELAAAESDRGTGLTVVLNRGADGGADRGMLTYLGAISELTADAALAGVEDAARDGARHLHVASFFLLPRLAPRLPELLHRAHDLGLTTSLDTNYDPAERWEAALPALAHLDLLLPNRTEVLALAGGGDAVEAAKALAVLGPVVVVKDGADGAVRVAPDGSVLHAPGTPVEPLDTTGAGDTFDAAYLDALLLGLDPAECLRRATTAGALSTTAVGGTAGQPTRDQLDTKDPR